MRTAGIIAISGWLAMSWPLSADLWTNQAGRVIEARLEAFDGAWVTLALTNGSSLRLPLGSLCQADQYRVRRQTGHSLAPAFVHSAYRDARKIIKQFERLPPEQRTEEARAGCARLARAIFDARLKPRLDELKDKDVLEEVGHLRVSLDGR